MRLNSYLETKVINYTILVERLGEWVLHLVKGIHVPETWIFAHQITSLFGNRTQRLREYLLGFPGLFLEVDYKIRVLTGNPVWIYISYLFRVHKPTLLSCTSFSLFPTPVTSPGKFSQVCVKSFPFLL